MTRRWRWRWRWRWAMATNANPTNSNEIYFQSANTHRHTQNAANVSILFYPKNRAVGWLLSLFALCVCLMMMRAGQGFYCQRQHQRHQQRRQREESFHFCQLTAHLSSICERGTRSNDDVLLLFLLAFGKHNQQDTFQSFSAKILPFRSLDDSIWVTNSLSCRCFDALRACCGPLCRSEPPPQTICHAQQELIKICDEIDDVNNGLWHFMFAQLITCCLGSAPRVIRCFVSGCGTHRHDPLASEHLGQLYFWLFNKKVATSVRVFTIQSHR